MNRELLIMRHAKSSWDAGLLRDFERPLAGRGMRDAPRMGAWLREQGLAPDGIVSSPARRARETAEQVCKTLAIPVDEVVWDERLYLADLATLLEVLAALPAGSERWLLVGHNPGLDELVIHLCGEPLPRTASGKLMTTAAVARVAMPDEWRRLPARSGRLLALQRPKALPGGEGD